MSQKDKCGKAEEMQLGVVPTFEAQSPRKRTMTSVFTGGAREALPRMGGQVSDGLRVSFHTASWEGVGVGSQRREVGQMKTEMSLGQITGKEQKHQAGK